MFQILMLEIVGIFSILNIYILWEQKFIYHLIAGVLIGIVLGIYSIFMRKKNGLKKIIIAITRGTNESGYIDAFSGLRQIGISLGVIGLMVFPSMLGIGNMVSIRIEEIGELIVLVSTIILDIFIVETIIVGPLMIRTLYKKNKSSIIIKTINKQIKSNKSKRIPYEGLSKVK